MTATEAISRARQLKPNLYDDDVLEGFLRDLDGKIQRELFERDAEAAGAAPDGALLVPPPYDGLYPLYLVAMVDFHNRETDSYQNDMALFNSALAQFRAFWRREHAPRSSGNWRCV